MGKELPILQRHECGSHPVVEKKMDGKTRIECPIHFVAIESDSEEEAINDWNKFYGNE